MAAATAATTGPGEHALPGQAAEIAHARAFGQHAASLGHVPAGTPDPPTGMRMEPPVDVPAGPPAELGGGKPAGVPFGPPGELGEGKPEGVPLGPPEGVPMEPPADVPPVSLPGTAAERLM